MDWFYGSVDRGRGAGPWSTVDPAKGYRAHLNHGHRSRDRQLGAVRQGWAAGDNRDGGAMAGVHRRSSIYGYGALNLAVMARTGRGGRERAHRWVALVTGLLPWPRAAAQRLWRCHGGGPDGGFASRRHRRWWGMVVGSVTGSGGSKAAALRGTTSSGFLQWRRRLRCTGSRVELECGVRDRSGELLGLLL